MLKWGGPLGMEDIVGEGSQGRGAARREERVAEQGDQMRVVYRGGGPTAVSLRVILLLLVGEPSQRTDTEERRRSSHRTRQVDSLG